VRIAVFVVDPVLPEIVAVLVVVTVLLVTVKFADVWPTGTTTFAGTVATVVAKLVNVTVMPEPPAGPLSVAVPVEVVPPGTLVGLSVSDAITGGLIVSTALLLTPPAAAAIVEVTWDATPDVVTTKEVVFEPAGTVTVGGTCAAAFELVTVTVIPPAGAIPVSITVAVDAPPPVKVVGLSVRVDITGGLTVSFAVLVTLPLAAEIVATTEAATAEVVIANVAVFVPAGTVTMAGTCAAASELVIAMSAPPEGALPVRVIVPVADTPPVTVAGEIAKLKGTGGLIVSAPDLVAPATPVMVATICDATGVVATVKDAVFVPAATTTLVGTDAAAFELESETVKPPAGALPVSVTFPVEATPPVTLVGVRVTLVSTGVTIVSVAVLVTLSSVPEMCAVVLAETGDVVTVKVLDVAPAGTVTVAGTPAVGSSLASVTTMPPAGAAGEILTVPVEFAPPVTLAGLRVTDVSVGPAAKTVESAVQPVNAWISRMKARVRVTGAKFRCVGDVIGAPFERNTAVDGRVNRTTVRDFDGVDASTKV